MQSRTFKAANVTRWVRLPSGASGVRGTRLGWALMRPARSIDELKALRDFRVWLRPQSFLPVLLSRVVIGFAGSRDASLPEDRSVDTGRIEALDDRDLAALERAYRELNDYTSAEEGTRSDGMVYSERGAGP